MSSKYRDFLHSDSGLTFAEYLGIEKPQYDYRGYFPGEYMMSSPRGRGQWCKTKKEAKASYKADLKARKLAASSI